MQSKIKTVIIGKSPCISSVLGFIVKAAESSLPVLIEGESGTGKELAASMIHEESPRADKPFIAINCGAMPKDLLENELFGHEAGAFTGATSMKRGLFEVADGGSLFVDEIAEMEIGSQAKLLRVIETGKFRRLGGTREIAVDVRVISATNRVLEKRIAEEAFRADLYYRLSVLRVIMPALRDRKEDLKLLVEHILKHRVNKGVDESSRKTISQEALSVLEQYSWPGNIRELQNTISRAALLCHGKQIEAKDLPDEIRKFSASAAEAPVSPDSQGKEDAALETYLEAREMEYLAFLLNKYNGDKARIMKILEISRAQFYRKLNKYGLK